MCLSASHLPGFLFPFFGVCVCVWLNKPHCVYSVMHCDFSPRAHCAYASIQSSSSLSLHTHEPFYLSLQNVSTTAVVSVPHLNHMWSKIVQNTPCTAPKHPFIHPYRSEFIIPFVICNVKYIMLYICDVFIDRQLNGMLLLCIFITSRNDI